MEVELEQKPLASLPSYDEFANILHMLSIADIAITRRVCKMWYENGRKLVTIYQIGLGNDGWSKWDADQNKMMGWGMRLSVDHRGFIRGKNKNNGQHSETAQEKTYNGMKTGCKFKMDVEFPSTHQINSYEGTITNGKWEGKFKLIKSCGHRPEGSGGTMEGKVLEC